MNTPNLGIRERARYRVQPGVRPLSALMACALIAIAALSANAAQPGIVRPVAHTLSIPAQSLDDALKQLSAAANEQLLFSNELVVGKRSVPVEGTFTTDQALAILLKGSGLVADRTASGVLLIKDKDAKQGSNDSPADDSRGDIKLVQVDTPVSTTKTVEPADGAKIEEVVVTAQRREQRLIDTPISIGVLTGDVLDSGTNRSVADALRQVPGVSMVEGQPGSAQIAVRGVLSNAGSSTTGYYLDEVPFSFIRSSPVPDASPFDLARIEVLRGPQGTLYGANSLNGVVRVLTSDAKLDAFEAKVRGRVSDTRGGGDMNHAADMAINVPIVQDKFAVRGVVSEGYLTGFIDSTNAVDGGPDINDVRQRNYRLKTNYQAAEHFNIKARAEHSTTKTSAPAQSLDNLITTTRATQPGLRTLDLYNLVATYDGSKVSLLSSTGYADFQVNDVRDQVGNYYIDQLGARVFSQEVRVASHLDGNLQFTAGGIYRDETDKTLQDARPTLTGVYRATDESESKAVFLDATQALADHKIELTAGLRYFEETLGLSQQGDFNPAATLVALQRKTYDKVTGRALVTFKPSAPGMYYASYSTGFRSGIFQSPATLVAIQSLPALYQGIATVNPDSIKNYELGAKGRLFGNTLSYEAAVYFIDWADIQQAVRLPQPFATSVRLNAGAADGMGAELALTWQATPALTLNAGASWSGLEFSENVFSRSVLLFAQGDRINDSPEWTGSAGADFRTATGMNGVDFVMSSALTVATPRVRRFLTGLNLSITESDKITDLKVSIGLQNKSWSVNLFGDNLLDEDGAVQGRDDTFYNNAFRLWPRTIGLQATFNY